MVSRLYQTIFALAALLLASEAGAAVTNLNPEGKLKVIPATLMIALLILFVAVGFMARAQDTDDYWAAGRGIGAVGGGMAIASNWMSAASYLGMAGLVYLKGFFGIAYVLGWTGGYVLLLVLMAGQIRRYGKYTAPDFIGDRYYSTAARFLSALVVILISFVYAVGQYKGIGMMFNWIFGINYETSVIVGTCVVLAYVLVSGMLGATKNMQVQYVVIVICLLAPLFFIANKLGYFAAIPQIGVYEKRTDRNIRVCFRGLESPSASGERDRRSSVVRIAGVTGSVDGRFRRDRQLDGARPTRSRRFAAPRDSFLVEVFVEGMWSHVRVDGRPFLSYRTPDGSAIEGYVGFAWKRGACRVQFPTVERLDGLLEAAQEKG